MGARRFVGTSSSSGGPGRSRLTGTPGTRPLSAVAVIASLAVVGLVGLVEFGSAAADAPVEEATAQTQSTGPYGVRAGRRRGT